ncbi:hypothetical protein GF339_20030 [candidate division KSB3 bacterium]|uniref:NADP-dependent oxidoreductase domain-containing protein n=1 Tax=candidate division KSB3 bacterium TaxID=2044937 RepID=A0A9D5JZ43_9BACT|nr:hypothetical protein [candidate division KSB3 bacterium]MBD3326884.1 hypothetical protein [candidate division KSB3 bacterium]
MEHRTCGKSEVALSALGLGCWEFGGGEYWGESDQKNVTRVVHRAVELGINYFDTAEVYNEGRSEEFLGVALKGIPRDQVVVGTKIPPSHLYPKVLREHCEASLKRLDMDYVDLYMIHWPLHPSSLQFFTKDEAVIKNPPTLDAAVETMLQLQQEGKIRHLALSNFGVTKFEEIRQYGGEYIANQLGYNLLTRAAEMEIFPYCQQHGVGVVAYMVLMQGILADRFATFEDIPELYKRTRQFNCKRTERCRHGEEGAEEELKQALDDIRQIAKECNLTMADVALKWTIAHPAMTCALVGTQNVNRLEADAAAVEEPLPPDIVDRLNRVTDPLKQKMGPSLDLFESAENDRTR